MDDIEKFKRRAGVGQDFDWTDETAVRYLIWDEEGRAAHERRLAVSRVEDIPDSDKPLRAHCYRHHPYYDPGPIYRKPTRSWREWDYNPPISGDALDAVTISYDEMEDFDNEWNGDLYHDWEE